MNAYFQHQKLHRGLQVTNAASYCGLPLDALQGPFVRQYLSRIHRTLTKALEDQQEVYTVCFELHFPDSFSRCQDQQSITAFWRDLKLRMARLYPDATSAVRYVWSRERDGLRRPYFRCCVFLDRRDWSSVGSFDHEEINLRWLLCETWARVLDLELGESVDLIRIRRGDQASISWSYSNSVSELFYKLSSMCSVDSTECVKGIQPVGNSRQ